MLTHEVGNQSWQLTSSKGKRFSLNVLVVWATHKKHMLSKRVLTFVRKPRDLGSLVIMRNQQPQKKISSPPTPKPQGSSQPKTPKKTNKTKRTPKKTPTTNGSDYHNSPPNHLGPAHPPPLLAVGFSAENAAAQRLTLDMKGRSALHRAAASGQAEVLFAVKELVGGGRRVAFGVFV